MDGGILQREERMSAGLRVAALIVPFGVGLLSPPGARARRSGAGGRLRRQGARGVPRKNCLDASGQPEFTA